MCSLFCFKDQTSFFEFTPLYGLYHPLLDSNSFFSDLYKKYYEGSFLKYSSLKDEILFEVIRSKISVWDYDDGKPYQEFFVIQDNTYQKVYYTI